MRIAHVSDTHGSFPPITAKCIDAIIHSGDLPPDPDIAQGSKKEVVSYWQQKWVLEHIEDFKRWTFGRPLLFVSGNHCHFGGFKLEAELQANGINAICLHDKLTTFNGINLYGLPYIPMINGYHAYELDVDAMKAKVAQMVDTINAATYTDLIVAHCPPWQILDKDLRNGLHWGNQPLSDALWSDIEAGKGPHAVCCGHVHSSNAVRMVEKNGRSILFSNAATAVQLIELEY